MFTSGGGGGSALFDRVQGEPKWIFYTKQNIYFLCEQQILNFRRVLYVVCFLLGNSPASEFYMPTFRNTLFHLHRQVGVK